MTTVLDASFAVNWAIAEDGSAKDRQLRSAASRSALAAPVIFWHEAASALRALGMRGVLSREERDDALSRLRRLGVELDVAAPGIARVLHLSDQFSLTVYDAAYLEFALRTGADLATDDAGLIRAAEKAGIAAISSG